MWTLVLVLFTTPVTISTENYFSKETCEAVGKAAVANKQADFVCIPKETS